MKKIMQITLKNSIHIQIGVKDLNEYKVKRDHLLKSNKDFITIIDTCTVKKEDVSIIEYFEVEEGKENE